MPNDSRARASTLLRNLRCPYCWGNFEAKAFRGQLLDADNFGTLTCDCGVFPILHGIPVLDLRHNIRRLIAILEQGLFAIATSECLMVDQVVGRPRQFLWKVLRKLNRSNRLWERVEACSTYRTALEVGYPKSGPYYEYLRCRFSDPTYVAGAYLLGRSMPVSGWILDLPSGTGHFAWALQNLHPDAALVTADLSFFNLLLLKRFMVPRAAAICLDGNFPLPFQSAFFDLIVSADGWHYVTAQASFLQELMRLKRDQANLILLHAHNRDADNHTAGRPFSYAELERLLTNTVADQPWRILDEPALARLAWTPAADADPFQHTGGKASQVFDVWVGDLPKGPRTMPPLKNLADGKWMVNPLYVADGANRYRRVFANSQYELEFQMLRDLLPETLHLDVDLDTLTFDAPAVRDRTVLYVPKRF